MDARVTIVIFILPLAAFMLNALLGRYLPGRLAGWIAVGAMAASTLLTCIEAARFYYGAHAAHTQHYFTWLQITPSLIADMGFYANKLTWMMMVVITTVSLLVFIYSIDYMKGEAGYARFFAFLSLFSFSMMGLVAAPNLMQLYMCWELVGLSSYLLIGFYYQKPAAVAAAKKAFIVTRFADFGFLIGILLLANLTDTLQLDTLTTLEQAPEGFHQQVFLGRSAIHWAMALIFIGGAGKSAMFPLHIWLPDAMEGPTPVSALIHAATMVVAGVFLVARLYPLFVQFAPMVLHLIAGVGAFSLFFAALIACTQTDIKRILAYSTMSQIGYMMLALGTGAYSAGLFHLFTHAFFKALLFLAAGVIIHAVHTQHIKQMGGLRSMLPATHVLFLLGCLAIAGIPPFAGFFSKDQILASVYAYSASYFVIAIAGAGLTAFYMFRLYFLVFWHQPATAAAHRTSPLMLLPMSVLGVATLAAGFVPFSEYVVDAHLNEAVIHAAFVPWIAVAVSLTGLVAAWGRYIKKRPHDLQNPGMLHRMVVNKFYIDEVYLFITRQIIFKKLAYPIAWFDRHVVDGTINALAAITRLLAEKIKFVQSGQLQHYAWVFAAGSLTLILMLLLIHYS